MYFNRLSEHNGQIGGTERNGVEKKRQAERSDNLCSDNLLKLDGSLPAVLYPSAADRTLGAINKTVGGNGGRC